MSKSANIDKGGFAYKLSKLIALYDLSGSSSRTKTSMVRTQDSEIDKLAEDDAFVRELLGIAISAKDDKKGDTLVQAAEPILRIRMGTPFVYKRLTDEIHSKSRMRRIRAASLLFTLAPEKSLGTLIRYSNTGADPRIRATCLTTATMLAWDKPKMQLQLVKIALQAIRRRTKSEKFAAYDCLAKYGDSSAGSYIQRAAEDPMVQSFASSWCETWAARCGIPHKAKP